MSNTPGLQYAPVSEYAFQIASITSTSFVYSPIFNSGMPINNIGVSLQATVGAGATSLQWCLQGSSDPRALSSDSAVSALADWYTFPYTNSSSGVVNAGSEFVVPSYPAVFDYLIAQSGQKLGPYTFPMFHPRFRIGVRVNGVGTVSNLTVEICRMVV